MTEIEVALIETVRSHPNPEQAMIIAMDIISNFLKQPKSFEESFVIYKHREQFVLR